MLERLAAHLKETGLIPSGATVLVAYSGGADSTCLLHLLHRLNVPVVAAHLHHGMRSEADLELKLCDAFCTELGIPFVSGRADVPRLSHDLKVGLEEAGRMARYNFFEQAAFRTECSLIATAHTQTDQAETVLLNLARGSGMAGAAGIPAQRGNIVRPMLIFSRAETRAYCESEGLWFHDDPANTDLEFSRARVRHRIIPELEAINPAIESALARFAEVASEEDRFLDGAAAAGLEHAEIPLNGDLYFLTQDCEAAFNRPALLALPSVLLKRAVRLAARAIGQPLDQRQTLAVVHGLRHETSGSVTAEGGKVVLEWSDQRLHVRQLLPNLPFRYPLTLPGDTESEEFGWKFTAYRGDAPVASQSRRSLETAVQSESLRGNLYFRTAEPGDSIQPYGFDGTRKVSDLLAEAGLTLLARKRLPIICDMVGPVWIPGICLSNRVKLVGSGERPIHIVFGPLDGTTTQVAETLHRDGT
jgi:tRNA(Ile)-lysidine synthase